MADGCGAGILARPSLYQRVWDSALEWVGSLAAGGEADGLSVHLAAFTDRGRRSPAVATHVVASAQQKHLQIMAGSQAQVGPLRSGPAMLLFQPATGIPIALAADLFITLVRPLLDQHRRPFRSRK